MPKDPKIYFQEQSIHDIDYRLWSALGTLVNLAKENLDNAKNKERVSDAVALVSEFQSCHGADGFRNQRGDSPQVWNKNTIFKPRKEVSGDSPEQLELDFENETE